MLAEMVRANVRNVIEAGRPIQFEEAVPMTEGERQYVVVKFLLRTASEPYAVCASRTDITERKRAGRTGPTKRTLQTLYQCNQALVRATEEYELLRSVCRILVEVGGLRMAWVGYANSTKTKRSTGRPGRIRGGYLAEINITGEIPTEDRGRWARHPEPHHILEQGHSADPNMALVANRGAQARLRVYHFPSLDVSCEAFGAFASLTPKSRMLSSECDEQYTDLANNFGRME